MIWVCEHVFIVCSRDDSSGRFSSWEFAHGRAKEIENPLTRPKDADGDLETYYAVTLRPGDFCFHTVNMGPEKGGAKQTLIRVPSLEERYKAFVRDGESLAGTAIYDLFIEYKLGVGDGLSFVRCDFSGKWLEDYAVYVWVDAYEGKGPRPSSLAEAKYLESLL